MAEATPIVLDPIPESSPLAGLAKMLDSVTPAEAAILASLATSTVMQAIALRSLPTAEAATSPPDGPPPYIPHPLDVLIFAAIETDGAMPQADLLAALSNDTYMSRGKRRKVTGRSLKARLPELVACGALSKTAAGYLIGNSSHVEIADGSFGA